jgi:hypothetical protein
VACFRWSNFLGEFTSSAGRPVLRVNLDETSIPLVPRPRKGYVIFGSRRRRWVPAPGPGPSLSLRRSSVSLVAFLCDDPVLQLRLPQVFVSNEHVLTVADVAQLNATCRPNVFVVRRKSSWVNAALLVQIVELLAKCLREALSTHRIVLHMDASRVHLHRSVLKACSRLGLYVLLLPASMTGWVQPLDVSVFSLFKGWVRSELERRRLGAPAGVVSRADIVAVYSEGIHAVMESKSWAAAFEATGLRGQANLSSRFMFRLGWERPEVTPSTLPLLSDFQAIYPRGADIPFDDLLELVLRRSRPVQLVLRRHARLPPAVVAR